MLDDFLVRAALAGAGTALAAGPLGCFVVWRRMAYFGDATAHAALLGVALALALDISVFVGVLTIAVAVGLAITQISGRTFGTDTLLGVIAHCGLALGIVAVALFSRRPVDLHGYLFGDILAVSRADLTLVWCGAFAVLAVLVARWSALLTTTVDRDTAVAAGIDPHATDRLLTLALAVTVAVALKTVGVLLIGALLVVPAAAARLLARGPETMALLATLLGLMAVGLGLWLAYIIDTPAGPTIVVAAAVLFLLTSAIARASQARGA